MINRRILLAGSFAACLPASVSAKAARVPVPTLLGAAGKEADITSGSETAPVVVIEYTSILCVYCRRFHADVMPTIRSEYIEAGKVHWISRPMPLRKSEDAVFALLASRKDGHELLEKLFARQADLMQQERASGDLVPALVSLGLTRDDVEAAASLVPAVRAATQAGSGFGVEGTPSFFVNGLPVIGAAPLAPFRAFLDASGQPG